mgnify:CR=1 FL=1
MSELQLSDKELELLNKLAALNRQVEIDESERVLGIPKSSVASLSRLLEAKGLVKIHRTEQEVPIVTEKGRLAIENGLPEERLLVLLLNNHGAASVGSVRELLKDDANIAIGIASRRGFIKVSNGQVELTKPKDYEAYVDQVKECLRNIARSESTAECQVLQELKARGLVRFERRVKERVELLQPGLEALAKARASISKLSHSILVSQSWKSSTIRPYDVTAEPPKVLPARKHPFVEFIEELKDIMKELGFVEVEGPLVEVELFNFDALFQPQDHPAREMHDTLWPDLPPARLDEYASLTKVIKEVHESGWSYSWSESVAARRILRSQTTSVSIRVLSLLKPKPPIRFFTLDKVFRADPVDSTHLSDFHQLDGIMGWDGYNFRDLLGFLTDFGERLGLKLRFKPAYFPFTEPSVEGYAKIGDELVEVFGAGLFRPEVLRIAGIDYQVGAWGMGVERLALAKFGLNDVRSLYSKDYNFLRSFTVRV